MARSATTPFTAAALLVAGCLLLSACASIPTSGQVEEGEQVQALVDDPLIRVLPRSPQPGLSRSQVVTGFLAASASSDDDHAVAREFLTPEASVRWDPEAGVSVYDDDVGLTSRTVGTSVTVTGRQVGRIGVDGAFTTLAGGEMGRTYKLRRVQGEWRISGLAKGLLLTQLDVDRSFRPYALQFLAPGQNRLVPDPVYVPIDRAGVSTSLTRALLDGPTRWLAPAVETALPAGTDLVVESVPVENGVAQVDLTSQALEAVDDDRERMVAQLVWTLTGLPDVTGVEVTVEGSLLPLPQSPVVQTEQTWSAFDPNALPESGALLVVRDGVVYRVDGDTPTVLSGPLGSDGADVRYPASSADGALVAALTADLRTAVLSARFASEDLEVIRQGNVMAPPSMDASGNLWLVERDGQDSRLWYKPVSSRLREVATPTFDRGRIAQLSIAQDGTRAAVITSGGRGAAPARGPAIFMCRVVRVGNTWELQAPRPLAISIRQVSDLTWSGSETLVILGKAAGSVRQPYQVQTDGTATEIGGAALQGITRITAATGFPLVAATPDGELWQNSGVRWRSWISGTDPAYPG